MTKTLLSLAAAAILAACNLVESGYNADRTPKMNKPSPKIDKLFAQTKPICFGRFIIDVPATAQIAWGPTSISDEIVTYPDQGHKMNSEIQTKIKSLKEDKHLREPSTYIGTFDGPNPDSKIVVGYSSFEDSGLVQLHSYLRLGKHAFVQSAPTAVLGRDEETDIVNKSGYQRYVAEMQDIARRLRLREETEVPVEPGICLEMGFVPEADGRYHEMSSIGFRFPEYPDVSFSITTTKTERVNPEDSLEAALKGGKRQAENSGLGSWFSRITTLREGARRVGDWEGAEKLARVPPQESGQPSTHEFVFRSVGVPKDMFRPYADIQLSTGVDQNTKGANEPSLKDEEAVILWDRLTSTLRTRPAATPAPVSGNNSRL